VVLKRNVNEFFGPLEVEFAGSKALNTSEMEIAAFLLNASESWAKK